MDASRSAIIKTGLVVTIFLMGGAAAVFIAAGPDVLETVAPRIPADTEASISIREFRQSSTRDSRTEWTLKAESASLLPSRKSVVLETLDMAFFMDDGQKVLLAADRGTLNTSTKHISVQGGIRIEYDRFLLHTDLLQYDDNRRILTSSHRTTIEDDSLRLAADSFVLHLEKNRIEFTGHVNCIYTPDS